MTFSALERLATVTSCQGRARCSVSKHSGHCIIAAVSLLILAILSRSLYAEEPKISLSQKCNKRYAHAALHSKDGCAGSGLQHVMKKEWMMVFSQLWLPCHPSCARQNSASRTDCRRWGAPPS